MEVEEGWGAIHINLETPASLRKRYKADHQEAYVHRAGEGSAHSDVEVRMIVLVLAILFYMNTSAEFAASLRWYVMYSHTCTHTLTQGFIQ